MSRALRFWVLSSIRKSSSSFADRTRPQACSLILPLGRHSRQPTRRRSSTCTCSRSAKMAQASPGRNSCTRRAEKTERAHCAGWKTITRLPRDGERGTIPADKTKQRDQELQRFTLIGDARALAQRSVLAERLARRRSSPRSSLKRDRADTKSLACRCIFCSARQHGVCELLNAHLLCDANLDLLRGIASAIASRDW